MCLGSAKALEEKPGISDPFLQLLTKVAGFFQRVHHLQLFSFRRKQVMAAERFEPSARAMCRGEEAVLVVCVPLGLWAGNGSAWVFCAATGIHSSLARKAQLRPQPRCPTHEGHQALHSGKSQRLVLSRNMVCANVEGKEKQVFLHFIIYTRVNALGLYVKPQVCPPPRFLRKSYFKKKN